MLFCWLACSERTLGAVTAAPKRVLIVTVTKGFRHSSIPTAEKVLGDLAKKSGASIVWTADPAEAVRDADMVYTDTWASMGQEAERDERLKRFESFQVKLELQPPSTFAQITW